MKNFHILIQIGLNFILKGPSQSATKNAFLPTIGSYLVPITQTNADPSKITYICH